MRRFLLLSLALLAPASPRAQTPSSAAASKEIDILSIAGYRFTMAMPLIVPFERLIHEKPETIQILGVENVPLVVKGNTYRYHLPDDPQIGPSDEVSTAPPHMPVLESEYGFFLFSAPEPDLMREFELAARRPNSYLTAMLPQTTIRRGALTSVQGPEGRIYSLTVDSPRPTVEQWRKSMAIVYRLWVRQKPVDGIFIFKTQGGLPRLASALESLRKEGRPSVIVSRGSLIPRDASLGLEGLRRIEALGGLGLQVSGVGLGEFRMWDELDAYRLADSTGVKFISANLVLSSAPTVRVFEPSALFPVGGLRVGFIGLTRPSYSKYMTAGKLLGLKLIDPLQAAKDEVAKLRPDADILVALSNLEREDNARLKNEVRGLDLILADDEAFLPDSQLTPAIEAVDASRRLYDPCLLLASEFNTALNRLSVAEGPPDEAGTRYLRVRQRHVVLDESVADHAGYPEMQAAAYGISVDSRPALIPAPRRIFPQGSPNQPAGFTTLSSRDFWTMAASLAAARTGSEAAFLPVMAISFFNTGDIGETQVRDFSRWDDRLATFELTGADILELLKEVRAQEDRERRDVRDSSNKLRLAAGGLGSSDTIHGVPIDPALNYRVAGSQLLLGNSDAYPALARAKNVEALGDLRDGTITPLRDGADNKWTPAFYGSLMRGAPVAETPLWKMNFRDISLNATNTNVVRDQGAFSNVANSRVQGFNQQLIGAVAKIDLDYLFRDFKWSNSFILDYTRTRLHPSGQPVITNLPTNRLSFLTAVTERVGSFPFAWAARSYGPSLGFQYEGEVERGPGPRRKNIYYMYPGVEFFNGTVIQSMEFSANLKRDVSRSPANNQYGIRARVFGASPIKGGGMTLQGETWANYFVLTPTDTSQDLRLEGDANMKLQIPIYHRFTLAPFIDFYYFELKVRPITGYSVITGLSLGFSRLWKPQYEKF